MTQRHTYWELLRQGVVPTESEVIELQEIGRFAEQVMRRVLWTERDVSRWRPRGGDVPISTDQRVALAVRRWEQPLGLGAQMFEWSHVLSAVQTPRDLASEDLREWLFPVTEEPHAPPKAVDSRPSRRGQRGLFGPRRVSATKRRQGEPEAQSNLSALQDRQLLSVAQRAVMTDKAREQAADDDVTARLSGGLVAQRSIDALGSVGIALSDLAVGIESGDSGPIQQSGLFEGQRQTTRTQGLRVSPQRNQRSPLGVGQGARVTPHGQPEAWALDGLLLDSRTPALAASLAFAVGRPEHRFISRLGAVSHRIEADLPERLAPSRILAPYDGFTAAFLALTEEHAERAEETSAGRASLSQPTSEARTNGKVDGPLESRRRALSSQRSLSLAELAPLGSAGRAGTTPPGQSAIRLFVDHPVKTSVAHERAEQQPSAGRDTDTRLWASALTFDRHGNPTPTTMRGAMFASRIALWQRAPRTVASQTPLDLSPPLSAAAPEAGGRLSWRDSGDFAGELGLGLGATTPEVFALSVLTRQSDAYVSDKGGSIRRAGGAALPLDWEQLAHAWPEGRVWLKLGAERQSSAAISTRPPHGRRLGSMPSVLFPRDVEVVSTPLEVLAPLAASTKAPLSALKQTALSAVTEAWSAQERRAYQDKQATQQRRRGSVLREPRTSGPDADGPWSPPSEQALSLLELQRLSPVAPDVEGASKRAVERAGAPAPLGVSRGLPSPVGLQTRLSIDPRGPLELESDSKLLRAAQKSLRRRSMTAREVLLTSRLVSQFGDVPGPNMPDVGQLRGLEDMASLLVARVSSLSPSHRHRVDSALANAGFGSDERRLLGLGTRGREGDGALPLAFSSPLSGDRSRAETLRGEHETEMNLDLTRPESRVSAGLSRQVEGTKGEAQRGQGLAQILSQQEGRALTSGGEDLTDASVKLSTTSPSRNGAAEYFGSGRTASFVEQRMTAPRHRTSTARFLDDPSGAKEQVGAGAKGLLERRLGATRRLLRLGASAERTMVAREFERSAKRAGRGSEDAASRKSPSNVTEATPTSTVARRLGFAQALVQQGPAGVSRFARGGLDLSEPTDEPHSSGLGGTLAPEEMLLSFQAFDLQRAGGRRAPAMSGLSSDVGSTSPRLKVAHDVSVEPRSGKRRRHESGQVRMALLQGAEATPTGDRRSAMNPLVRRIGEVLNRSGGTRVGLSKLARAWFGRVSGERTGLDLELEPLNGELRRLIRADAMVDIPTPKVGPKVDREGVRHGVTSSLADTSPIQTATRIAAQRAEPPADRSGLRKLSRVMSDRRDGSRAGRSGYEETRALQGADWRLIQTGSTATFQSGELNALTTSVMDNSPRAQAMPMPLIAPAVKAVAQSAMRKGRDEPSARVDTAPASGQVSPPQTVGESAPEVGTLSRDAFESLAVELADHVSRRIQREKERKGQWP